MMRLNRGDNVAMTPSSGTRPLPVSARANQPTFEGKFIARHNKDDLDDPNQLNNQRLEDERSRDRLSAMSPQRRPYRSKLKKSIYAPPPT